jgi:PEGA domain
MTTFYPSVIEFAFSARLRGFARSLAFAFTAWLLLAPTAAHADALTAEALFQSGREALEKGDARAACDRFQESYRLDPTAGTALNLGNCRERLGQLASAWQRYEEAVQKLPDGDPRVALAASHAARLLPLIPHLTLLAPAGAADFVVTRDGEQLGQASFGLALPVDPGPHVVQVHASGHVDWSRDVALAEGQQLTVTLELGASVEIPAARPATATPEAAAPDAPSAGGSRRAVGWATAGIGAAGIATSLVSGVVVLSKKSTVESNCVDKRCSDAGLQAAQTGRTFSTVGTVAFGVGAAALGVGLYLILSRPAGTKEEQARLAPVATRFGASATSSGLQLRLESSF